MIVDDLRDEHGVTQRDRVVIGDLGERGVVAEHAAHDPLAAKRRGAAQAELQTLRRLELLSELAQQLIAFVAGHLWRGGLAMHDGWSGWGAGSGRGGILLNDDYYW